MCCSWPKFPAAVCGGLALMLSGHITLFAQTATLENLNPPRNLSFSNLVGANFEGENLRNADLSMGHFVRANFKRADFTGAKLDRIEIEEADLSDARGLGSADFGFGINAQRARFTNADLSHATITGTYFEGADFRGANLEGAFLSGNFKGAAFDGARVKGTVMLGAFGIEPSAESLRKGGAIVTAEDFIRSVQGGRDYSGANLKGFNLPGAQLPAAPFRKANLHSATLSKATLGGAVLAEANLCWATLDGASLKGADLTLAHLIGTDLTGADLSGINGRGAELNSAVLRNANLAGADLSFADLSGADLTGVDLTGAKLLEVKWESAILENLRGIPPASAEELKSKAARWKYDLDQWFNQVVPPLSIMGWLLGWPAGVIFLLARKWSTARSDWKVMASLHAVAGMPFFSYLFFLMADGSPTAQFSGSSSGWSLWFDLWPVLSGAALLALGIFVPVVFCIWWARRRRDPVEPMKPLVPAVIFTGLSLAGSAGIMLQLAPDA